MSGADPAGGQGLPDHDRPARPRPVAAASRWAEALAAKVEQAEALDPLGRALVRFVAGRVRPGPVKDLLSGTWMGHPTHPMLTDVPIGAWTSAFVLDLVGGEASRLAATSLVGLGVVAALPTALTGLSDLSDVEDKPTRRVGSVHAVANAVAVGLYGASYLARRRGQAAVGTTLSTLGAAAVTAGGFLGGHLSYRKGIGVDHTAFEAGPQEWTAVTDEASLPEGKPQKVVVAGAEAVLYRSGDAIYALANRCTHRGGPLDKGRIEHGTIRCPWHLSRFRLADGAIVQGPASAPQPAYDVRVREGRVELRAHA